MLSFQRKYISRLNNKHCMEMTLFALLNSLCRLCEISLKLMMRKQLLLHRARLLEKITTAISQKQTT